MGSTDHSLNTKLSFKTIPCSRTNYFKPKKSGLPSTCLADAVKNGRAVLLKSELRKKYILEKLDMERLLGHSIDWSSVD